MALCAVASWALLLVLYAGRLSVESTRQRLRTYLCAKTFVKESTSYAKFMGRTNRLILAATGALLFPPTAAGAKSTIQALQASQNLRHLLLLKSIGTNRFCTKIQKVAWMSAIPYKFTPLGLSRTLWGEATARMSTSATFISGGAAAFALISNLKLNGNQDQELKVTSKEVKANLKLWGVRLFFH